MNGFPKLALMASALMVLGGCAVTPTGPTQLVLPGTSKTFQQFRIDDAGCRQHASAEIGDSAQTAAADATARSAVVGTAVGAIAGAAIGGSRGAGVGAGSGLLVGTASGSGAGAQSGYSAQRRYDNAYIQCMYAAGHRVPISGQFIGNTRAVQPAGPIPPSGAEPPPPPPAGAPPAPPPGASG